MNYRFVLHQLGLLLAVLSAVMLALALGEAARWWMGGMAAAAAMEALLISAGLGLASGGGLCVYGTRRRSDLFGRREALLLVALSWLFGAALCAMPFLLWAHLGLDVPPEHAFRNYIDCYFEAMSGLTTTGATVLSDIPTVPPALLLWRALTHWLGGLGIVVLFVAVLPSIGTGAKRIFHFEAPGPAQTGVRPRIRETARVLWLIYLGLTLAQAVALRLCGMHWFDAFCHTFATLATGGFSTQNASIAAYSSTPINIVVIVFMILAGVNFGLYYRLIRGSVRSVLRDTELRVYLGLLAGLGLVVSLSILFSGEPLVMATGERVPSTVGGSVEHGLFSTVSIMTTTGFVTADFDLWPFLAQAALVLCMFIGGSAGSTASGIKVVRVWTAMKIIYMEVERVFSPNVVRPVRQGGGVIDPRMRLSMVVYVLVIVLLFALGSVLVMLLEPAGVGYTTAATASLATLLNIGPGLEMVGAVENYGWMTGPTKALLCVLMALGRLEVFTILVLFLPGFWRKD